MSIETILVPDLGGAEDVEVIEICVAVGDTVELEQSLIVLETDKASMEVPCPKAGTVKAISLKEGDTVNVGDAVLELEIAGESVAAEPATAEPEAAAAQPEPAAAPEDVAEAAPAAGASAEEPVVAPDLGGAEDVDVIEICVNAGDEVAEGDSLIVLETDKASMEVPAPKAGTIVSMSVAEGDKINVGDTIAVMSVQGAATPVATAAPAPDAALEAEKPSFRDQRRTPENVRAAHEATKLSERVSEARPSGSVYAGPAVRKLARELGVDLAQVAGSGPKGRIQKEDLQNYVKTLVQQKGKASAAAGVSSGMGIPPIPEVDFSQFGEVNIEPMTKMHKVTAANMHRSWLNVPHVTQFDDVDITDLEQFRSGLKKEAEKRGVKITPLPFLLKACAAALKNNPKFNASLHADGEHIVYKQYIHIGMAVDTPAGLVVPVIRDVDQKNIWELAAETAELAQKAKDRKLKPADMQGGCFTISSLGGIGGAGFTPIVNAPEVGILGVSKLDIKPRWNGSEFEPRKMLPLSLSYDHRAVNGGDAGRFMTYLGEVLSDIRRLALS